MAHFPPLDMTEAQGGQSPVRNSTLSADHTSDVGQRSRPPDIGHRSRPPVPAPLRGFARGLQQRQLDTIAFFLKSNETIFQEVEGAGTDPARTGPGGTSPGGTDPARDVRLEQLESLVQLVLYTVEENSRQLQLRHFTEQVLHLLQEHLQKLTRSVVTGLRNAQLSKSFSAEIQQSAEHKLTLLTDYTEQVKQVLQVMERSRSRSQSQSHMIQSAEERRMGCVLSDKQRHLVNLWDSLDPRAVTVEGILTGELSLLQNYLMRRCGNQAADLTRILETGLEEGLAFIHDRDIASATNMFANMGFDPDSKLRQICMYTTDHVLRDYIVMELQRTGKLSAEERHMVEFVHTLETLYSCTSYTTAKLLRQEETKSETPLKKASKLSSLTFDRDLTFDLESECGDLVVSELCNSETSSYSQVILEWVRHWPLHTRDNIILEHNLARKDISSLHQFFSAAHMWQYMCCHLDVTRILKWIHAQFPTETVNTSDTITWPYNQPITREMLECISMCPQYLQEDLKDDLARRGVFVPSEQNNLHLLLRRLSKIHAVFHQPHLVTELQTSHGVTLADVHYKVVKWCIEQKLPQFLCSYLDNWHLGEDSTDLSEIGLSTDRLPVWVTRLLHCRLLADTPHDIALMYRASVLPSMSQFGAVSSVRDMLDHKLVIRAVATLAYNSDQYKQLVEEADAATVQLLSSYPQLQQAMVGEKRSSSGQTAPLTVYHLLRNNGALSVSRLFGWQRTHTSVSDDCVQSLPHFGAESLVVRYGREERLDLAYYLRQGRPCSAFCVLLSELQQSGARSLPLDRLYEACRETYVLGVQYFSELTVAAACVTMVEILGIDATPLRLHIHAANTIALYLRASARNPDNQALHGIHRYIGMVMLQCLKGNVDCQNRILTWLTAATYWRIQKLHTSRVSVSPGESWQSVLLWCTHYDLPLTTQYLRDCAVQDQWQLFLTHAQVYNFPTPQLLKLVESFPSRNLRQHLVCVLSSVHRQELDRARHCDGAKSSATERHHKSKRDVTSNLQRRRSDVTAGIESSGVDSTVSEEDATAHCADGQSADRADRQTDRRMDLLLLLQGVQQAPNPAYKLCTQAVQYKLPVLAVLAASYKGESMADCIVSWLLASVPYEVYTIEQCLVRWSEYSTQEDVQLLTELRDLYIDHDLLYLLHNVLNIFSHECELLPFLRFIRTVRDDKCKPECMQELLDFKQKYRKLRSVSSPVVSVRDPHILSVSWIEGAVARMTQQFLASCQNSSQSEMLLTCLDELSVLRFFECKVIDVSVLLKLNQLSRDTGITMDYVLLGNQDHTDHRKSCDQFLGSLLDKGFFKEARTSSEILGIQDSSITIRQLATERDELQSSDMWSLADTRWSHWMHCQDIFDQHQVAAATASQYFLDQILSCTSHAERANVYQLSYDWLHKHVSDTSVLPQKHEIFIKMWRAKIQDYLENKGGGNSLTEKSKTYKLHKEELLTLDPRKFDLNVTQKEPITAEEEQTLQVQIGQLLNKGCLSEVIRIIQHFGCDSTDFSIILSCLELAKGRLKPEDLSGDLRKILSGPRTLHLRRISTTTAAFTNTLSMVNVSSLMSQCDLDLEGDDEAITESIQRLSQSTVHAKHCAAFILTAYNIARVLSQRFDWVLMLEDFALIHRLLSSQSENRYVLAKGYIITAGIDDTQVAGFLCDAIVEALQLRTGVIEQVCTSYGTDKPILLKPNVDESGLRGSKGRGVQELLQLCVQPSVLGSRLLDTVVAMVSANSITPRNVMSVEVELLVYAHDCFTLSCHMEGISTVLRTARTLTLSLQQADEFILMQHQFELLFRKGVDRDVRLRLAILDYLQKHHPQDVDTYSMAALNFTMYREIAGMLVEEANRELNHFKGKTLDNTSENQSTLKKALRYFSDAAESYVKENCLRHAERCVNQARLVALQTHLLSSKTRVVHLDRDDIQTFVCKHAKFYEAYIVCEAYNTQCFWSDALYHQVIKAGSTRYLHDLRNHIPLTPTLILEVAQRYRLEPQPSKQMMGQMKKLISFCHDLSTLHQITALLGLHDTARDMIKSDIMCEAYLKDAGLIS